MHNLFKTSSLTVLLLVSLLDLQEDMVSPADELAWLRWKAKWIHAKLQRKKAQTKNMYGSDNALLSCAVAAFSRARAQRKAKRL